jgi:hypothetical protein
MPATEAARMSDSAASLITPSSEPICSRPAVIRIGTMSFIVM